MKELIGLAKKRPAVAVTGSLVVGAVGIYGFYSLKKASEEADIAITKDSVTTRLPYDSVATAEGATSGSTINVFSEGTRPNSSANHAKAEKDINVTAQRINTGQQNLSVNADAENKFKMRK